MSSVALPALRKVRSRLSLPTPGLLEEEQRGRHRASSWVPLCTLPKKGEVVCQFQTLVEVEVLPWSSPVFACGRRERNRSGLSCWRQFQTSPSHVRSNSEWQRSLDGGLGTDFHAEHVVSLSGLRKVSFCWRWPQSRRDLPEYDPSTLFPPSLWLSITTASSYAWPPSVGAILGCYCAWRVGVQLAFACCI